MGGSLRARVFLWALVLLAAAGFDYWVWAWKGAVTTSLVLCAVLFGLAVLATNFSLSFTPRHRVNLAVAVNFSTILLTPMPIALLIIAASQLVGGTVLQLRRRSSRRGRSGNLSEVAFNTSRHTLAAALGGIAFYSFGIESMPAPLSTVRDLLSLPLGAIVMNLVDGFAVALLLGIQVRQNPARIWLNSRQTEALQPIALYLLGYLGALISVNYHWALLIAIAPATLLYLAVRRAIRRVLFEQTVSAVEAMADTVDMRDHYTFEHSRRVTEYAVRIAGRMGLADDEIDVIRLAARVHDLGKIGVPDQVLLKEGRLTEEEMATIQQHPKFGYDILGKFPEYRQGKELVLYHHERYDGRGYPHGLDGGQLPLGAQIIAVADSLDAMTTDRPYRRALFMEQAMSEFAAGKGQQWNPDIVVALEQLVGELGSSVLVPRRPVHLSLMKREQGGEAAGPRALGRLAERLQVSAVELENVQPEIATVMLGQLDALQSEVQRLERWVTVDELTGTLRREAAESALEREINRTRRSPNGTLAIALVDIRGLRNINESAGQAAGDRLLGALADALRAGLRSYDLVGRWGDDEFICIVPDADERDATRILSQLATAFELRTGSAVTVGLSVLRAEDRTTDLVGRAEAERRRSPLPRGIQTPRVLRVMPPTASRHQAGR